MKNAAKKEQLNRVKWNSKRIISLILVIIMIISFITSIVVYLV